MSAKSSVQSLESVIKRGLSVHGYFIGPKIVGTSSLTSVYQAKYIDRNCNVHKLACQAVCVRHEGEEDTNGSSEVRQITPRELAILLRLQHPHVVRVHSILNREDMSFVFWEFTPGANLLRYIKRRGPLKEPQARKWFQQLVSGLRYLHANGVAHRDLRCETVLITRKGHAMLSNIGLDQKLREGCGIATLLAVSSRQREPVAYLAPEVILGQRHDPMKADAWSLGVVLFMMLSGAVPFADHDILKMVEKQRRQQFSFGATLEGSLSQSVRQTVKALLNPVPNGRLSLDAVTGIAP